MSNSVVTTRSGVLSNSSSVNPTIDSKTAVMSHTISRNHAKGKAFQMNGDIVGQTHHWEIQIFNSYLPPALKDCAHPVYMDWLPGNTSEERTPRLRSNMPTTQKPILRKAHRCPEPSSRQHQRSAFSDLQLQFLNLLSKSNGKKRPVCAIFESDCARSYISKRIVKRFALTTYVDSSAETSTVVVGSSKITPSRVYVVLVTPGEVGIEQTPYHFYVVEHCRFDVLIGSNIITNLSSSAKT
ncbi:hypothetical protein HBI56_067710 [Parastagonospora nodorum]|nr:hypothetical protein HBH53_129870 [Parastagonospora nodorum]KAH3974917.1 hypothetical protein HBH51_084970 [Parastagonospora nodorum]KAH3978276.1 hypothetical protein HBH52_107920 [Parastagonospora nodorum]KAH4001485.1 hypothetical protein HBI10_089600 [Parastagonospora nodorum]KAH4027404.1 hypothetical protein HBI13_058620 [Parastagonospora nodorum]